jgi:hypothetical protein
MSQICEFSAFNMPTINDSSVISVKPEAVEVIALPP